MFGLRGPGSWPACEPAEQPFLALSYSAENSASSLRWPPWPSQQTTPDKWTAQSEKGFTFIVLQQVT